MDEHSSFKIDLLNTPKQVGDRFSMIPATHGLFNVFIIFFFYLIIKKQYIGSLPNVIETFSNI